MLYLGVSPCVSAVCPRYVRIPGSSHEGSRTLRKNKEREGLQKYSSYLAILLVNQLILVRCPEPLQCRHKKQVTQIRFFFNQPACFFSWALRLMWESNEESHPSFEHLSKREHALFLTGQYILTTLVLATCLLPV